MILAIDPALGRTAYVLMNQQFKPVEFGIKENFEMLDIMAEICKRNKPIIVAIEMIACYGMAVSKTVFETCVWIGRFQQLAYSHGIPVEFVYRKDVKMNICGQMRAKDANVNQALRDRFGEVGVKKNQGFFYGFKADIWAAYAVGVTWLDKEINNVLFRGA